MTPLPAALPLAERLDRVFSILGLLLAVLWGVEILDAFVFGQALDRFGIRPRSLAGLRGILCAPFLHGSFAHLAANSLPFAVLGGMILLRGARDFVLVTLLAGFASGIGVWVLGAPRTVHIGASGLVFGYFGFLVASAWWERTPRALFTAALVLALYGGLVWGIRPFQGQVSWLGHLFGLLGGIGAAHALAAPAAR